MSRIILPPEENEGEPTWWERHREELMREPFNLAEVKKALQEHFEDKDMTAEIMIKAGSDPAERKGATAEKAATARRLLNELETTYRDQPSLSLSSISPLLKKWYAEFETTRSRLLFKVLDGYIIKAIGDVIMEKKRVIAEELLDDREYLRTFPADSGDAAVLTDIVEWFFGEFFAEKILNDLQDRKI